ncbi:antibiotic biosynthesis monooxygenase [Peribacillus loiseleuriae]|uniref:antibiotic biosynthesis monooxygenase n=1 Tax=Peribacillus loiseleuriae TaxID=1679170 RepID=UPI003803C218
MFVITNTLKVEKGNEEKVLARFERLGGIEETPGFILLNVLKTRGTKEYDEFTIFSKWESKEAHDQWTKTESFRQSHSGERSEYVLDFGIAFYDVVAEKAGTNKSPERSI